MERCQGVDSKQDSDEVQKEGNGNLLAGDIPTKEELLGELGPHVVQEAWQVNIR